VKAVTRFQKMNGLQVDGVVGAQTAGLMMDQTGVTPGALSSEQARWLRQRAKENRVGPPLRSR
jgi:murein L,D-transpeptidase YcbB/YkuD